MIIQEQPPLHLTYCLNIHPGESWAEHLGAIQKYALQVKQRVCPEKPFGLGLRLGRAAAETLAAPARLEHFKALLHELGLYVFTINGFPYGSFHDSAVKDNVYLPDWRSAERRHYTNLLADILAALLPAGTTGSISTVPGAWRKFIRNESDVKAMSAALQETARYLARLRKEQGAQLCLALEPEPGCFMDSAQDVIRFFHEHLLGEDEITDAQVREHLGVCLDTCHVAVRFDDTETVLKAYRNAGIRVAKVQLSAALRTAPDADVLQPFAESTYLHQVRARSANGALTAWDDLPAALASPRFRDAEEVRVHFHVPLFFEPDPASSLRSTADLLTPAFFEKLKAGATEHIEIETYSFALVPRRLPPIVDSIAEEFHWVLERLADR